MTTESWQAAAGWLDELIERGLCWSFTTICDRLPSGQDEGNDRVDAAVVESVRIAFSYQFDPADVMQEPKWMGGVAVPVASLAETPASRIDIWAGLAAACRTSEARALLQHLVLLAGPKADRRFRAERAAAAYLELAQARLTDAVTTETVEGRALRAFGAWCAHTALSLASTFRLSAQADAATKILFAEMRRYVDDFQQDGVGHLCALARALGADRANVSEVRRLLEDATVTQDETQFAVRSILEELIDLPGTSGDERANYQRRIVESLLAEADRVDGFPAVVLLDQAAKRARNYGVTDLADEAVRLLQVVGVEASVWSTVRTEMPYDPALVRTFEAEVNKVATAGSLADALRIIGSHPALGGPTPTIQEITNLTDGVVALPVMAVNSMNLPIRITGVPNGIVDAGVTMEDLDSLYNVDLAKLTAAKWQIAHMLLVAPLVRDQLDAIPATFTVDPETVLAAIAVPGVPDEVLERLARVLRRFWSGDPGDLDDAVHVATGVCERLLRHLLLRHDAAIFTVQRGQDNGQLRLMTRLLEELAGKAWFDPDWRRSLELLLCREGVGLNVRNAAAHGELGQVSRAVAALVVQACLFLLEEIRKTI